MTENRNRNAVQTEMETAPLFPGLPLESIRARGTSVGGNLVGDCTRMRGRK